MRVRYRTRALADIDEIYRYLEPRSPVGARNVLRTIHDAIDGIARHPYAAERTSQSDVRVRVLGRYRYKIFYAVIGPDEIEIIHIRHAARRPWQGGE